MNKDLKRQFKSKISTTDNVHYELRDKDGNIKPLFNENKLGFTLLKLFRKLFKNPIDSTGQIKAGLGNYLAAYGLRLPFITGTWKDYRVISNLITSAGKAGMASRNNGSGGEAAFTYIALGTGVTGANVADTTLQTETSASGLARVNATASRVTTSVSNDTAQLTNAFAAGASVAITESGILNAASVGTLLARQTFSAVNVISGDTFTPTWKVQHS